MRPSSYRNYLWAIVFLHLPAAWSSPLPDDAITTSLALVSGATPLSPATAISPSSIVNSINAIPTASDTAQSKPFSSIIKRGYVAFGDSYAAGLGTGVTSTDNCRNGEFSYPQLIRGDIPNADDLDFQFYQCSGATASDVLHSGLNNNQIDKWNNTQNADMATISIGGNDIGFFDVLSACVIRAFGSLSGDCNAAITKAYAEMSDTTPGDNLHFAVNLALQQIIAKSGRSDFRIYMKGYPAFFNVDTDFCNTTQFNLWDPPSGDENGVLTGRLTKDVRIKLNNLVTDLNTLLSGIVDGVNQENGNTMATFVDPARKFDSHRFCEQDDGKDVKEPDYSRSDTWLFLSGWSDNAPVVVDDTSNVITPPGDAQLPDPATCSSSTDWFDQIQCGVANAITVAGSPEVATFAAQQAQIASGDLSQVKIPWWEPTWLAKTFHPRTLGQLAYKESIQDLL